MANVEDLGKLMTAEQGKPVGEAMGEVQWAEQSYSFICSYPCVKGVRRTARGIK